MSKIRIGDYSVAVDDDQFTLYKVSTVKKKDSENFGKEVEQLVGYYPKLSQLSDKLFHLEIARSDSSTLEEIKKVVRSTRKLIDSAGWTRLDFK